MLKRLLFHMKTHLKGKLRKCYTVSLQGETLIGFSSYWGWNILQKLIFIQANIISFFLINYFDQSTIKSHYNGIIFVIYYTFKKKLLNIDDDDDDGYANLLVLYIAKTGFENNTYCNWEAMMSDEKWISDAFNVYLCHMHSPRTSQMNRACRI